MKKKLLMMLAVMLLLVGCGNTNTPDTEADTQQTESQSTSETETLEADTEEETTTEVNTEVESETPTQTETESEAPQPSEEPSKPETPTYTYTDMDKTMYAKSSVNVRDLPSTDGNKLGGLSKAQEVHVTGQCNETGWYRMDYNGSTGYVSSSYLVNDKPAEPTPEPEEPTQPSEPEECPVTLNTIIDCGDYFYMWVCRHTQDDMGQPGLEVGTQYAIDKWGTNWSMKGCNDHIEWNGYIICQEVWSYTGQ